MRPIRPERRAAAAALAIAAVAVGAAGCGGGTDETQKSGAGPSTAPSPAPQPTVVAPTNTTRTEPRANNGGSKATTETAPAKTSPETQPGGAGDEEAARSEITFTGNGGTIAPVQVRVAPFIQIKVTLESKDDAHYAIAVAGKRLDAGLGRGGSSVTIPGLRQQKRYKVRVLAGEPGRLTIVASSEPGP